MPLVNQCKDCNTIIPYSKTRCPECEKKYEEYKRQRVKYYDKNIRRNKEIYHDKRWIKLSKRCRDRFYGIDIYQLYVYNRIVYGSLSHHVEEVEDCEERRFDITNLIWVSGNKDSNSHAEIHTAYNKSAKDKAEMQLLLFSLIKKFEEEYGC